MLLPLLICLADVICQRWLTGIATSVSCGRCYYHLADVMANVADVIATGSCLFQFKFCDVVQNLIPYMRQMVFAYVLVWGCLAIYIRVNNPSLNKNIGKYHLPHIWDKVLNNITELKLK